MTDGPSKSTLRTSQTLLERVRDKNDQEAWKEFISYYEQYIYNILRHINVPEDNANELCQEIIIKLWKKMPDFVYNRDRGKFRGWLSTIIRNETITLHRKDRKIGKFIQQDHEITGEESDPKSHEALDSIIADEWQEYVLSLAWKSVKERFRENMQEVFMLHIEGKSIDEICEACNIKKNSVYVYIQRIRIHLKEEIKKIDNELL